MTKYIYQHKEWPHFHWDTALLAPKLANAHQQLGRLEGRMESLGFNLKPAATLLTLTEEVVKNSEIENEILDPNQVRSSLARRLGIPITNEVPANRHVEGAVEIALDAIQQCNKPLTKKRLFNWHAALFPTARSGMNLITVGGWRNDYEGPMQVISGPFGRERIHFEAPAAALIDKEMKTFLAWFNDKQTMDPIIKAGIAHLWFITLHPFEDGNGRIARTLTDLQLARSNQHSQHFYSLSAQIQKERAAYYTHLESAQKKGLDVTDWLTWFLSCISNALISSSDILANVLRQAQFWKKHSSTPFNDRQRLMLTKLFEGFIGKLTTSKWAKITKCSQDTATRDIHALIELGILAKESAGGRSTSYILKA